MVEGRPAPVSRKMWAALTGASARASLGGTGSRAKRFCMDTRFFDRDIAQTVACDAVAGRRPHVPQRETAAPAKMQTSGGRVIARHFLPGGREHGGGIGRLVGYIVDEGARRSRPHAVTDTRGPRLSVLASPLRLAGAILVMVRDRIAQPSCIQHIHLAGRGSTIRKLVLTAVARAIGCVHVLHLHDPEYGVDVARRPSWMQRVIRGMFREADHVITLGGRDRQLMLNMLGVSPDRVTVMHNAVPDPGPRTSPERPEGSPVQILFLGRLSDRKGVPELIAALASDKMRRLGWTAVLAGDGPVDRFRDLVTANGLGSRVTLPGWLGEEEVKRLCRQSDILVLPSHAEGLAMSVLEGMAHGLAVVATRVGAHEEVLSDRETGLFVSPGDPLALADALARLIIDGTQRARLATRARARFEERLCIDAYMDALDMIYEAVERSGRQPLLATR